MSRQQSENQMREWWEYQDNDTAWIQKCLQNRDTGYLGTKQDIENDLHMYYQMLKRTKNG